MLFSKDKKQLNPIKELKFDLERNLQELVEINMEGILGLQFISTEFQLNGLRIDSLALDTETNSFVIIEYKRGKSFSVIDQGYAYLSLMLNNKADFILEYFEKTGEQVKKNEISWSESRVIFVANSFTIHQRQAINFKDLPIELREAKKYQGEIYSFDRIKANAKSESIKTINKDESVSLVTKEIKTYTIADHIKESRTDTQALYEELSEGLLTLDQRLDEDPKKVYIGYKIGNQIVVDIKPRKSKIVFECLRVEPKDMKDPENKLKYMEKSMQHYNKHVSQMEITSSDDITYALMLTKQIINKFFS